MKFQHHITKPALFTLTLALGALAVSAEQSDLAPRKVTVEKSRLVSATPRDVWRGYSHYLKVTLNYSGQKPSWWMRKNGYEGIQMVDPLLNWQRGRKNTFMLGHALTVQRPERIVLAQSVPLFADVTEEAQRYVVTHPLRLGQVAPQDGEVTFHGLYALNLLEPLRWKQVVRKAGQKISLTVDRNPHATIQSISQSRGWNGGIIEGLHTIEVVVRHPPRQDGQVPNVWWDNVEIINDEGRVLKKGRLFEYYVNGTRRFKGSKSLTSATLLVNYRTSRSWTLRGKLSVNDKWPQDFSVKLSPL